MTATGKAAGSTGKFETGEPTIYESAIRPWDVLVDLRKARDFHFRIQHLSVPGIVLYRDTFQWDTRVQGMSPPNTLSVGIPINAGENSRFWSSRVDGPRVYSSLPTAFDAHFSAGQGHMVALIDLGFASRLSVESVMERTDKGSSHADWAQSPKTIGDSANNLQRILDAVSRHPEALDHSVSIQSITDDIANCIRHVSESSEGAGPIASATLNRAVEYLNSVNPFCATVTELCVGAGLNTRALQRAIQAAFDCTVRDFLRRRRFHSARRLLLASDHNNMTVTTAALELGFYDVGRFARDYFLLFGEKPSQTIKSRADFQKDEVISGLIFPQRSNAR